MKISPFGKTDGILLGIGAVISLLLTYGLIRNGIFYFLFNFFITAVVIMVILRVLLWIAKKVGIYKPKK